uniref:ADF-H domain-containing protein n=1 Tax=Bionectria ochroleuca TaxID=29856 RepID=A0A8H7K400_BIOOC
MPSSEPIFGDQEIQRALESVQNNDNPDGWFLLSSAGDRSSRLVLFAEGKNGLDELKDKLVDNQVLYGYQRIEYNNDTESKRVKFVVIVWIGPEVKVMRRARVSVEKGGVIEKLGPHATVDASDRGDIVRDDLVKQLRKNGGADYNGGRG